MIVIGRTKGTLLAVMMTALCVLLVPVGLLEAQQQEDRDCVLGAGGGIRITPEDSVLNESPATGAIIDVRSGGTFRLDLVCPVGEGGLRIGGALESEALVETLALHRFLAMGRLDLSGPTGLSGPWRAEAVAVAGWTQGVQAGPRLLVAPVEGKGIDAHSGGPTVGLGLRLARRLTGPLSADLRLDWRGVLMNDELFSASRGIFGREVTNFVHTFPITLGIAVEL